MTYSIIYKNKFCININPVEEDKDYFFYGFTNFCYNGHDVNGCCEGNSLYEAIKDFMDGVDETIRCIDRAEERLNDRIYETE